jgi:acetylornithine deacetylase/succinyl-diaminopimelate desuccinylase-like protein
MPRTTPTVWKPKSMVLVSGFLVVDVAVVVAPPVVTEPVASPLYDSIKRQIEAREPEAVVVPYLIPGFTDAKYFTQMGARWYGFSPVKIEKAAGIRFADMFHGHDERIPVAGLAWGVEVLDAVVREIST